MKRLLLILPVIGLILLSGCGTSSTTPAAETGTTTPVVQTGTTIVTTTVVDCHSDVNCIQPLFLACTPATFTPPFSASSSLQLEIIGKTNDICDYKMTRSIQGMLVHKECKMPMSLINTDRAIYLFSKTMDPAELAIDQAQQGLDTQYCIQI